MRIEGALRNEGALSPLSSRINHPGKGASLKTNNSIDDLFFFCLILPTGSSSRSPKATLGRKTVLSSGLSLSVGTIPPETGLTGDSEST